MSNPAPPPSGYDAHRFRRRFAQRSNNMPGKDEMEQRGSELIEGIKVLERQQAKLRRANRGLRLMTSALILFAGALVLMSQTTPPPSQSVEAEQFVLRGSDGKVRGAMGI